MPPRSRTRPSTPATPRSSAR
ncbi:hypothetical protein VHUM_03064 [Vanrija humicola]|uniref:Uncharacterized protein n=1 Tax=Vanrija humicola TaxID=5417 RepID=A0A7D8Z280_VANHU|nr:hypothetical protein VHUM_03064 [Vanrija humicola]